MVTYWGMFPASLLQKIENLTAKRVDDLFVFVRGACKEKVRYSASIGVFMLYGGKNFVHTVDSFEFGV